MILLGNETIDNGHSSNPLHEELLKFYFWGRLDIFAHWNWEGQNGSTRGGHPEKATGIERLAGRGLASRYVKSAANGKEH